MFNDGGARRPRSRTHTTESRGSAGPEAGWGRPRPPQSFRVSGVRSEEAAGCG